MTTDRQRGLTLAEVLVALGVLSISALAVADSLAAAQRVRRESAHWTQATQLAAERMERVRSGDPDSDSGSLGIFTGTWQSHPVPGYDRLRRIDVTVTWTDRTPQQVTLSALMR